MNMEDMSSLFVKGPLSKINQLVTCHPVLDKNDIIQLGVGIGNLRSFVASKVYSASQLLASMASSGHEDFKRVDTLTWGGGPYISFLHSLQAEVRKLLTIVNATAVHYTVNCISYHLLYPSGLIYPFTP
jgi:hypothetical protein